MPEGQGYDTVLLGAEHIRALFDDYTDAGVVLWLRLWLLNQANREHAAAALVAGVGLSERSLDRHVGRPD